MKLYNWQVAPNPRRVRMYIAEKGLTDIEIVDVGDASQPRLSDDYLANNPHRIVPALELDDGTLIGEVPVICQYLERIYPEVPLFGSTPEAQAQVSMWDRKCELEGLQACAEMLRNKVKVFDGRALPGYTVRIEQIDALVERGAVRLGAFWEKLDARLGQSSHLAGDEFTFADITGFCTVDFAKAGRNEIPAGCSNVQRWYDSIASRDSASA